MGKRKSAKWKLWATAKRSRTGFKRKNDSNSNDEKGRCSARSSVEDVKKGCKEVALTEDAWISCQTDVNKLVQRHGCPEDDNLSTEATDDKADVISLKEQKNLVDEVIIPVQYEKTNEVDEKPKILLTQVMTNEIDKKTGILPLQSSNEWMIKKSLCRCCHAEGSLTSLHETVLGDITYDHMLKSCFNIQLFTVSGAMGAVCALCAARLRDAYAFGQQVRACDAHFRDLYQNNFIKVPCVEIEVKEEPHDANDDFNSEMDATVDAPDDPVVEQEVNPRKVAAQRKNHKNTSTKIPKETALNEKKPRVKQEVIPRKVELKRKNDKNTSTETESKEKKPIALQSTLLNNPTPKPPPVYTRVGVSYKCNQCEKLARCRKTIIKHFQITHMEVGAYECTHCLQRFMDETELLIHKLDEHNIDERYKCNACDKAFNRKRILKRHMNIYHMMGEKIKCSMCDYDTYDRCRLDRHLVKHKTSKDFHCKYCKKSFMRKNTLNFHERIHTGDKRKACAECGQKFVQKASLNYHMAKYHPEVRF